MNNLEIFNRIKARVLQKAQGDLIGLIDRSIQTIEIPSVSSIGDYAFSRCASLKTVTIPNSVTIIGAAAFYECTELKSATIPNSVKIIRGQAFRDCHRLASVTIPNSVKDIEGWSFRSCRRLASVTIPNSVTSIGDFAFYDCGNLENVILENGFAGNGLDLSASTKFSVDTMIAMFNALADLTGQQAKTLTLGSTNLAKLSNEQIAIATEKNWTLA